MANFIDDSYGAVWRWKRTDITSPGAGKYQYAVKVSCQLITLSIIGGIPLALLVFLVSPYLLGFIACDTEVYVSAINYISIIALSIPIWDGFDSIESAHISVRRSGITLRPVVVGEVIYLIPDPVFMFEGLGSPEYGFDRVSLGACMNN